MKKSRFSEEKIISILREADAGVKVAELVRKHGISAPTYYLWKAKYGDLEVSQRQMPAISRVDDPRDVARAMAIGQSAMADYEVIRREDGSALTPNDTRAIHQLQLACLRNELSKPTSRSTVVVTHHLPHPKSIHAKYRDSPLNPGLASDMSDLVKAPVKLWIHGHTHESIDYVVEGTRVICNPRGYLPEEPNKKFMPKLVVEIDA